MQIWDPEAIVALGGFPRFAAKFKSNKGSLAQLTYLSLNEFMQNCWKKSSSVLVLLIVGQIHFWSSTHTEPLISNTALWIWYWSRQFHGSAWNQLYSGLIASILHQFCSYFKQIFDIKLCQCKELCFSSVSQTIWHGWSHHLPPDMNPRFAEKAKEEIQCGVVELGSALGAELLSSHSLLCHGEFGMSSQLFATIFEGS